MTNNVCPLSRIKSSKLRRDLYNLSYDLHEIDGQIEILRSILKRKTYPESDEEYKKLLNDLIKEYPEYAI